MEIACPACDARYEVATGMIRPGRAVRCARCGRDWVPVETADIADIGDASTRRDATMPIGPEAGAAVDPPDRKGSAEPVVVDPRRSIGVPVSDLPRARQVPASLVAAWVVTIVVLVAACWFCWHDREAVMRAWPPSARLYGAPGAANKR